MAAYTLPGIFVMGCLVYLMESYVIRCPEQAEWNIRAEIRCQNTITYFCLYNYIANSYQEGCTGPDWDRSGSKRVYSRNFNRAPCNDTRYQPIKFVTNGNSDCIFRKSLCTDEGQTLFSNGTTRTDSTCRCDYTQGYAYVTVPRSKCSCRPSEEDCSCYLKKCQGIGYYLSPDYECTKDITNNTECPSMSANPSEDPHIDMAPTGTPTEYDSYAIKRTYDVAIIVSICLFVMIVSPLCAMFIERLLRCLQLSIKHTGNAESKRMDTGPSLDTNGKNVSNHESAGNAESKRSDTGRSLNTIDQNVTNNQSAVEVHTESESMYTCPSLNTTEQNASNDESDGNRLEEIVSGNNEDNQIASRGRYANQKSALDEIKNNIRKEKVPTAIKDFIEFLDKRKNGAVKLAVTGIASSDENWKSALGKLEDNIDKERLETAFKQFNEDLGNWKNETVELAVTGKSGIASKDENLKSALDELKDEKESLGTALAHFNQYLYKWKNEAVKLAVIGKSGVGKSSFINAIRNLKTGDPGFATSSSSGNTTTKPTVYEYPGNPNITLHDLPGYGTIKLPTNEYEKTMELHKYDYILIFVGNIEENDIEIAKKLREMKKPFCFVRSKIDLDIQNGGKDGEFEKDIVEKIMLNLSCNLKHAGFNKAMFFVISNHNRRIYQFHDLVLYIQSNLPGLKYEVVMFSILGELSVDEIESKYKILKDRLWKISLASVALGAIHVSHMDRVFTMSLICEELLLYHKVFGFEQQCIKDILKNDHIRQKLNVSSIIEIQPNNDAMYTFAKTELEKLRTSEAREIPTELIIPVIESSVSGWPAGGDTFKFLIQVLDGCKDDSKLVYSHQMLMFKSTDASTTDGDMTL